ncbi:MAG: hypothetical protein JO280_03060 [Mycobacteriaceae bacterium]|nr:hypothetical protein [Mycobacteriaceae bacterium]
MVRRAFAHDAVVVIRQGGSPNAPGGAIAVALCGHWDHPPPCPLAPHHVENHLDGETVTLRVLFATKPANEQRVRSLIEQALAEGRSIGPDGRVTMWQLRSAAAGSIRPDETDHAARLVAHSRSHSVVGGESLGADTQES